MINDNSSQVEFNAKLDFQIYNWKKWVTLNLRNPPNSKPIIPEIAYFSIEVKSWYDRYRHLPFPAIKNISEVPQYLQSINQQCEACQKRKSVKASSPQQEPSIRSTRPYQLLHSDIWEAMRIPGIDKLLYMITLVNDYSRLTLVKCLEQQSNAGKELLAITVIMEKKKETKVEIIQMDNGGEYRSTERLEELNKNGITIQQTIIYHSQTN
jgi:IS30 family transposase